MSGSQSHRDVKAEAKNRPPLVAIRRLLIANRGEIASRILSTARELEIETYCIYTAGDSSHTVGASHSIQLPSAASYLDISALITLVKKHEIDAIHPGYGFLSESAEFARRMWFEASAVVIGPGWAVLERTGDKLQARALAEECHVPVLPATKAPTNQLSDLQQFAEEVGYPLIIKAVDGGGGRGIRIVREPRDLENLMERALKESPCGKVFAEKAAIDGFRHVEVQIVGNGGRSPDSVRHLWERECSIQRRFQKVIEFTPSSITDRVLVAKVIEAALVMARKVNYISLGTFEFLVRSSPPEFYFLEVNPRLQVEHTISESIFMGEDLVKMQMQIAMGHCPTFDNLPLDACTPPPSCALQLRVTAEDVLNSWVLSVGKISSFRFPNGNGIRVDTHLLSFQETSVGTQFDSLLAKIVITGPCWKDVVKKAGRALADTRIDGVKTNLDALRGIVASGDFEFQRCDTQWLESSMVEILDVGKRVSTEASKTQPAAAKPTALADVPASVVFRKGDAWSVQLALETTQNPSKVSSNAGHLQVTRVLRNEFPASLSASILYTPPAGEAQPYTVTMTSTSASAGSITSMSKHRRGDPNNPNHIIIPFPGQLMEILVENGDIIAKGDVVAVVRQMKMELEIRSPGAGKVVWAFEGDEGEEVGEGLLIAEIMNDHTGASKL